MHQFFSIFRAKLSKEIRLPSRCVQSWDDTNYTGLGSFRALSYDTRGLKVDSSNQLLSVGGENPPNI